MADPRGFLKAGRVPAPKRPVHERIGDHRHVYDTLPMAQVTVQAARCMGCGVPFCTTGCPLGNLIPDWNDLVYREHWKAAIDRLHATNNFPEFTGMLCPAPCEASCVLAINNDAVTIKEIELSIVNRAFEEGWIEARPPTQRTGKRVAVVGSGPAGLAAAQQLNRAGHHVTVFEKDDRIGGLLRYGIPDFKIEKWVIDRRLDQLESEGIAFRTGAHVGHNPSVTELRSDFDAVLLSVGALAGRELSVPGRELRGIHQAMDYLTQQNRRVAGDSIEERHAITARDKRVIILGGGDTGADCLGNAHREGAASVQVLTWGPLPPSTRDPLSWPDWPFVLRSYPAHEEGGERHWSVTVTSFSGNGSVERLHAHEVERLPNGMSTPVPEGERVMDADLVLLSIGFAGPVKDRLLDDLRTTFDERGCIAADDLYRTSTPGVYAAGDAKRGASLIVWAIAEGREAARQIDLDLTGSTCLTA